MIAALGVNPLYLIEIERDSRLSLDHAAIPDKPIVR
jgi:hypothetical protein